MLVYVNILLLILTLDPVIVAHSVRNYYFLSQMTFLNVTCNYYVLARILPSN